ncbi:MAG: YlxR family protein [Clostridia bacterium]|nr:YlxR family protein [Clostridia bacterium]
MKNRTKPMRRCIGCMESKEKEELIRVTWYEGELAVDTTGKAKGRGVYICKNRDCIAKAAKKGAFARSLRVDPGREQIAKVTEELERLVDHAE